MSKEVMKKVTALCALISQFLLPLGCKPSDVRDQQKAVQQQSAAPDKKTDREWHAATYRGLTVGKSTREEMLHVLGKPKRFGPPVDQPKNDPKPEIWYDYENGGEFPGDLTLVVDKRSGIIIGIDLYPDNLSKEEAIKHFGDDYIVTRYAFDDCLGNLESGPVYESPKGPIVMIEYRNRGIAIGLDETGKVNQINYVSKPIGAASSRCKK